MTGPRRSPVRITRRTVLTGLGAVALTGLSGAAYGIGIEPMRLTVTRYEIRPLGPWPAGFRLRIVALSDIHACEPWMSAARIAGIVETANGLGGDAIVLLGDYVAGIPFSTRFLTPPSGRRCWAVCARRSAPTPSSATTTGGTTASPRSAAAARPSPERP